MEENLDTPIALRRTPRRSRGDARATEMVSTDANAASASPTFQTPSRTRTRKRVRFSDPGPETAAHNSPSSSTGLTPMIRRSTLESTVPSSKKRRHSTPGGLQSGGDNQNAPDASNEVHFFSLRQVLDDRVKRRIRRNGLSEEMNIIDGEKRQRAQKQSSEIQRLRRELAQRDEEIEGLRNATVVQDTERILQLEEQIDRLRAELNKGHSEPADQTRLDWTMAAQDPYIDGYMDEDDEDEDVFGDTTMADLVCSTPTRARASFPTPPSTSPMLPTTPPSMRRQPLPRSSHTGVQAQLPDPHKEALEAELGSVRLELTKLTDVLAIHEDQRRRLSTKLSRVQLPASINRHRDVEEHLDQVLQSLSDKTDGLVDINTSLSALGFQGGDSIDIVASIANALRTARLELEYLTPGEITLPLSAHGAEVLDLVLVRLRELSRQVKEDEVSIDEYHALELSLRQQLGARVEAMDGLRREAQRSAARLEGKDARIAELEVGADRLKGAIEGYRRDVVELEALVQRVEEEGQSAADELRVEVDAGRLEIRRKDGSVRELEGRVASLLSQTADIKRQLADAQTQRAALNRSQGAALALRDARVTELRGEIDGINAALRTAHETICQLRVQNVNLENSIDGERKKAKEAVDSMKAELARVLEMSEGILATPKKGGAAGRRSTRSSSSQLASGSLARKRRKYDSGLGFLSEEEGDI